MMAIDTFHNLVAELDAKFPGITWILFGSRAASKAKAGSDWDLGILAYQPLAYAEFRKIKMHCDELCETLPIFVDVVNLMAADEDFKANVVAHSQLISGDDKLFQNWKQSKQKSYEQNQTA